MEKGGFHGEERRVPGRRTNREGERQPVMARLASSWRRSNFVMLVTLRKGNYPGEA